MGEVLDDLLGVLSLPSSRLSPGRWRKGEVDAGGGQGMRVWVEDRGNGGCGGRERNGGCGWRIGDDWNGGCGCGWRIRV